jgi:hypothetical protein
MHLLALIELAHVDTILDTKKVHFLFQMESRDGKKPYLNPCIPHETPHHYNT